MHYSNAGYIVLGLVIEVVSGQQYVNFVQERVFDRAGMSSSGFFRLDEARPNVAIGYLPRPSPDAPWRSEARAVNASSCTIVPARGRAHVPRRALGATAVHPSRQGSTRTGTMKP